MSYGGAENSQALSSDAFVESPNLLLAPGDWAILRSGQAAAVCHSSLDGEVFGQVMGSRVDTFNLHKRNRSVSRAVLVVPPYLLFPAFPDASVGIPTRAGVQLFLAFINGFPYHEPCEI
ncbi:MAG TPA: hypothetical protein DEP84_02235 [Chloroflexi bacterium]|nr:hypothetical protein [Chloroflexota bacterium]